MWRKTIRAFAYLFTRAAVPLLGFGFWALTEASARGSLTYAADWAVHYGWQFALNLSIVLAFFFMTLALAGRFRLGFWLFAAMLVPFSLANALKMRATGFPLLPLELKPGSGSLSLVALAQHLTWKIVLITGGFLLAGGLFLHLLPWFRGKFYYVERVILAVLAIAIWGSVYNNKPYPLQAKANVSTTPWDPVETYATNGFLLSTMLNVPFMKIEKPKGYGENRIQTLLASGGAVPKAGSEGVKPNVIVILSEAFWDPTVVKGITFSEDPIPFLHGLLKQYPGGWLQTPQFGGGTANVEFEVLTSQSMRFLPKDSLAYVHYVNHPLDSLASILSRQGYESTAINPLDNWFFASREAYRNMGFRRFVSSEFFEPVYEGMFLADSEVARTVFRETDRTPGPDFVFANTMENHYPFYPGKFKENTIRVDGSFPAGTKGIMETYAQGIHSADNMLKQLVEHYGASKEPTMIVFFGDHLPALDTEEKVYRNIGWVSGDNDTDPNYWRNMYRTPFVVWDNFLPKERQELLMSPSFLGPYVLSRAGRPGTAFTDYVGGLARTIPVIPPEEHYADLGIRPEQLDGYRQLEYDAMFGRQYAYRMNGTRSSIAPDTIALGDGEPVIAGAAAEPSGDGGATVTVRGSGFAPKADVYLDGALLETKRLDAGTLRATMPKALAAGAHAVQVKLIDAKGFTLQTSNTAALNSP